MIFLDHAINRELVVRVCSVATHAPANNDEQIPVRVPQAPSEDITVSLFATTPPLGYSVADPLAQAAAQASTILILFVPSVSPVADPLAQAAAQASTILILLVPSVSPVADPLAQAPAQASTILILLVPSVSPVADPLAQATPQILPVMEKIDDEIPQILPRLYPVPEEITQIAVNIAISVARSS